MKAPGFFYLTVLLVSITAAVAQPADERLTPTENRFWSDLVKALQPGAPPEERSSAGTVGQDLATAGREDLVQVSAAFAKRTMCKPLVKDGKPVEPLAYIAEAARGASVTMINEDHAGPLTRYFISQVARRLRAEGYSAYGAETFTPQVSYEAVTPPIAREGYYLREPIYGRLVRQLRTEGYHLFPYEFIPLDDPKAPPMVQAAEREVGEAANLLRQVRSEKGAKVLVHVGHGHLTEYSAPGATRQMGQVFAEASNINPLTIETTRFESPDSSFVVCDPQDFAGKPVSVDIRIGVPKLTYERGRVKWRHDAGDRFVDIPASLQRPGQIAVFEARPAGERTDSTPMDRLLLKPGENLPLLLPPGRYDLSVWTEKDGWSASLPLRVAQ